MIGMYNVQHIKLTAVVFKHSYTFRQLLGSSQSNLFKHGIDSPPIIFEKLNKFRKLRI